MVHQRIPDVSKLLPAEIYALLTKYTALQPTTEEILSKGWLPLFQLGLVALDKSGYLVWVRDVRGYNVGSSDSRTPQLLDIPNATPTAWLAAGETAALIQVKNTGAAVATTISLTIAAAVPSDANTFMLVASALAAAGVSSPNSGGSYRFSGPLWAYSDGNTGQLRYYLVR